MNGIEVFFLVVVAIGIVALVGILLFIRFRERVVLGIPAPMVYTGAVVGGPDEDIIEGPDQAVEATEGTLVEIDKLIEKKEEKKKKSTNIPTNVVSEVASEDY